jgi:hypothetical protein
MTSPTVSPARADNDDADVAGLSPVDLIELFQRGEPANLMGSNELSRTTAYILILPIFGMFLELQIRRVNVSRKLSGL